MVEFDTDANQVAASLFENFDRASLALGISMEMINDRLNNIEARTDRKDTWLENNEILLTSMSTGMLQFEMVQHSEVLLDCIMPDGWDAEEPLLAVVDQGFRLSPKDRWEENGVLDTLLGWRANSENTVLWIGGKSGNQDTWVTELSADIVQALKPQQLSLAFVFCDDSAPTPIQVLKMLIAQLLTQHPNVAYNEPTLLSTRKFKSAQTYLGYWRIFEQLVLRVPNLFLIIDRVEEIQPDEQADLTTNLIPSLIELVEQKEDLRVIVTSVFEPPSEVLGSTRLLHDYIDTERRAARRR